MNDAPGTVEKGKILDLRVKHLEMIQAIVARTAANGTAIKNYCLTLTTAICGLSITLQRPIAALVAALPIVVFALLDAQYLRVERDFRSLFDRVRCEPSEIMPTFGMTIDPLNKGMYRTALLSWSIIFFYGSLAIGVVSIVVIERLIYDRFI